VIQDGEVYGWHYGLRPHAQEEGARDLSQVRQASVPHQEGILCCLWVRQEPKDQEERLEKEEDLKVRQDCLEAL
jgi:hypothetical protein